MAPPQVFLPACCLHNKKLDLPDELPPQEVASPEVASPDEPPPQEYSPVVEIREQRQRKGSKTMPANRCSHGLFYDSDATFSQVGFDTLIECIAFSEEYDPEFSDEDASIGANAAALVSHLPYKSPSAAYFDGCEDAFGFRQIFEQYSTCGLSLPQMYPMYPVGVPHTVFPFSACGMCNGGDAWQIWQQGFFGVAASIPSTNVYSIEEKSRISQQETGARTESDDNLGSDFVQKNLGVQQKDSFVDSQVVEVRTTVMLRNIPNNVTRAELLDVLEKHEFRHSFGFLYLPMDFKTKANLGYAFIDLNSVNEANRFYDTFDNRPCRKLFAKGIKEVCKVVWSDKQQGLDANLKHWKNNSVMHFSVADECKPVRFCDGHRVPFLAPSKPLRPPNIDARRA